MKKQWSVKYYHEDSRRGSSSALSMPHTKLGAWLVLLFSLENLGWSRVVVNHDDQVRAWGRHDFVRYPTAEDLRIAARDAKYVIQSIAPGQSVAFSIPLPEPDGSFRPCIAEGEAK